MNWLFENKKILLIIALALIGGMIFLYLSQPKGEKEVEEVVNIKDNKRNVKLDLVYLNKIKKDPKNYKELFNIIENGTTDNVRKKALLLLPSLIREEKEETLRFLDNLVKKEKNSSIISSSFLVASLLMEDFFDFNITNIEFKDNTIRIYFSISPKKPSSYEVYLSNIKSLTKRDFEFIPLKVKDISSLERDYSSYFEFKLIEKEPSTYSIAIYAKGKGELMVENKVERFNIIITPSNKFYEIIKIDDVI